MTRIYHDQFAKQCLAGFLAPFGTTEISREITSEVRQVDVWFEPHGGKLSIEAVPLQRFLSDKRIGLVCIVLSNNSKDFVDELCLRDTGLLVDSLHLSFANYRHCFNPARGSLAVLND